jgi:hypothetical protein
MPGALVASAGTRAKYRLEAYATLRHHTSIAFRGAEGPGRPPGQWRSSNDSVGVTGVMERKTALRCSVLWTALTPRV